MKTAKELFEGYRARSTQRIRDESRHLGYEHPIYREPPARRREPQLFEIGDTVRTTGRGAIRAGEELVIKDAHYNGPYIRYLAGGIYHRHGDLEALD